MKKNRLRLDVLLVERGLFETRAKAQAAVMAGKIKARGLPALKAGVSYPDDVALEVVGDACPYVSRGGLKLESALKAFGVNVKDRVCLDVGASTGGFTDCLLKNGASKVYAVDVGTSQLDVKLRGDARVVNLEQTHARTLRAEQFDPRPNLAVIDVAFISLTMVLPYAARCLAAPYDILALIKPQFELTPKQVPKGVVKTDEDRRKAVEKVRASLATLPVREMGLMECPVHGPKGNIEYFLWLSRAAGSQLL